MEFYSDNRASDNCQSKCKKCWNIKQKEYRKKNWHVLYPKHKILLKKWREENPEKNKQIVKNYRDKYKGIQKNYRKTSKGVTNSIYYGAKQRAAQRNMPFDLEKSEILKKVEIGICELTGIAFDYKSDAKAGYGRRRPYTPSIDRIDNSKGYTKENCRIIISAMNIALNEWGEEMFLKLAQAYLSARV